MADYIDRQAAIAALDKFAEDSRGSGTAERGRVDGYQVCKGIVFVFPVLARIFRAGQSVQAEILPYTRQGGEPQ